MERPTCSNDTALEQAGDTAHVYLFRAIKSIDFAFGNGYAKKHPELVAAMIQCQSSDFANVTTLGALYTLSDAIEKIGNGIAAFSTGN